LSIFIANMISTSVALAVSYLLHSRLTFAANMTTGTLAQFVLITLSGLWLLQPLVIVLLTPLLAAILPFAADAKLPIITAKFMSIGVTLIWNYTWYSRVIFAPKETDGPAA
jgi:putative flippase GtrA